MGITLQTPSATAQETEDEKTPRQKYPPLSYESIVEGVAEQIEAGRQTIDPDPIMEAAGWPLDAHAQRCFRQRYSNLKRAYNGQEGLGDSLPPLVRQARSGKGRSFDVDALKARLKAAREARQAALAEQD